MHEPDATRREWDAFYVGTGERSIWSGHPNGALVAEAADLPPGTALDVGCGEGADAIWLAERGWRVTAVDPSEVALERARAAARAADVEVRWVRAGLLDATDATDAPGGLGTHDLVSVQYPGFARSEPVVAALLDAVAPGGTLLVVHHDLRGVEHHQHRPGPGAPPEDLLMPRDVAAALGAGWTIEVHTTRPRTGPVPPEARHVDDVVLRARRSG
jgi:SAM-dependent methyltransferase